MLRSRNSLEATVALCVAAVLAACDDSFGPDLDQPLDAQVATFVDLMNAHRVSVGCAPLVWATDVADVAAAHSADMVERGYFAHVNPDGESPFDRLSAAGIDYGMAAENIAWGYPTPEAVLQAWLNSPGHRGNIENCGLAEHGVGRVETHWTHVFVTR